jgi:hypothetical protein
MIDILKKLKEILVELNIKEEIFLSNERETKKDYIFLYLDEVMPDKEVLEYEDDFDTDEANEYNIICFVRKKVYETSMKFTKQLMKIFMNLKGDTKNNIRFDDVTVGQMGCVGYDTENREVFSFSLNIILSEENNE